MRLRVPSTISTFLLTAMPLVTFGCISHSYRYYPSYVDAMKLPKPETTKIFSSEMVDWDEMPAMVPYMVIHVGGHQFQGEGMKYIWKRARDHNADMVHVGVSGVYQAGSVSIHLGYGAYFHQPVYKMMSYGICYRLTPGRLGIWTDGKGLVQAISKGSGLREAGLQEGDTILSINGIPYPFEDSNRWGVFRMLLRKQPGEEIDLVWLRPGQGRMEGRGKLVANKPKHLDLRDVIPVNEK